MSAHCCEHETPAPHQITNLARYRKVLWIALGVNLAMFLVEIAAGIASGSLSLQADAIDFAGDALNYGVSLAILTSALSWRSYAAIGKAISMVAFGLFILGEALWAVWHGSVPDATAMGAVATLALVANVSVAWMLYAFREGDANMRSVWLCSRNDAIGNLAVMAAAAGVIGTGSAWPDLAVASLMAALALSSGWAVLRQARSEMRGKAAHDLGTLHTKDTTDQGLRQATYRTLRTQAIKCINLPEKWQLLQAAHIVGQCFIWLHIDSHIQMLKLALRTRDWREAVGQIFRLGLVPFGHLLGRLPIGNPGTADVSAFSTQEIPHNLRKLIVNARVLVGC
jgi:Co/Zn/Cd efflux system component